MTNLRVWTTATVIVGALAMLPTPSAASSSGGDPVGSRHETKHGAPVLTNVVREAGIATPDLTYSGEGVDIDRDGDQDIFISNHTHGSRLWRNNGRGRFTRIARYAWPPFNADGKLIDRHHCAWADVDGNGRPDTYCTTGRTNGNYVKRQRGNELWLQRRDGHFVEVGAAWHVTDVCGRGRSAEFIDANGDRFPDLFLANSYPRKDPGDECDSNPRLPNEGSKLFINVRGTSFRYAPRTLKVGAGMGEECIDPLDFNGDGWQDLYLCRKHNQLPVLFRNRGGHGYVDVTSHHELSAKVSDAVVVDLDRDGDPDLVTMGAGAVDYQLNVNGTFAAQVEIGAIPPGGDGWAVAVADIDGDGDRDIYGMVGDEQLVSNPNDIIWLRDGWTFTPVPVPPAGGLADDIVVVHPWRSGRVGLLVLNGYDKCCGAGAHERGPIALFHWNAG